MLRKAYLEITNVCNLRCEFCPGTKRAGHFLTPEEFMMLACRLRPHTEYLYLHLMGEPLLHPQLEVLLSIAASLRFRVMITTNGTLLPQQRELLWKSPAVERVSISLHSFEGNGQREGLEDYLENCLSFAAQTPQWGKRCVLRLWNLDGTGTKGANRQNDAILAQIERWFPRPWRGGRRGSTLALGVYLEWGERFDWPDRNAPPGSSTGFCQGLRDQVGVLCDGTVVPCCLDHEGDIPLGNLFDQPLDEILASPKAQAIYHGFSQRRVTDPLCLSCGYRTRFS
jgi:radical SAM protein with 4Fe4S-binding SPASM domain